MTTKINKIVIFFFMVCFFQSCTNLEEEPVGLLAPESFFNTSSDAEAAVMGGYSMLARNLFYGRRLTMTLQLLGDQVDIGDIGTRSTRVQTNDFQMDPFNDDYSSIWNSAYLAIGSANSAIDGIPGIEMEEDRKNSLIGEASMIRALSYYHLVQLFGAVPYVDEFVTDPNSLEDVTRTPVNEVYNNIIEDLKFAVTVLPEVQPNNARSRVTKGTAHTMLSKVYLILGEWDLAAEQAELVINNAGNYGYDLVSDYKQLWDADLGDQEEHIWTVDFLGGVSDYSNGNSTNVDYIGPMTGVRGADMQGWSVMVASPGMYPYFPDTDYRKEVSFLTEALVGGELTSFNEWLWPRIHIGKWNINAGQNADSNAANSDHNLVIFRYAEVLLIAAEALNEANGGPTAKAYEYINKVRERARNQGGEVSEFPEDVQEGLSQEEFREAVRKERTLELAFEWKRWYDLKRWGIVEEAFTEPDSFEPHPDIQPYHTLLPIPQEEISRSPNLTQNDGY
ncbi:RagB/SusD family nutrient uptake outer membrane protein [Salegentibacter sp. BDJ18]|uniref:RagB/SusD family nutrient uptake outer membrane protein n=1 Tax=Salegentibacter sp. BDJ18 TaxID=2816376 RepID=UPI001AAE8DC4|nr:RagB/SusD family nutrient uptake outer membrane protein [Salegentibacter sp. BDJ18]MBO2543179.1 RagB/SusD family nutrient uptake outer membrane protein [Salegentibacter sp. BDJ18]